MLTVSYFFAICVKVTSSIIYYKMEFYKHNSECGILEKFFR